MARSRNKHPARGATLAGLGAGVVALGCCVGPAVAVLFGLMSATVAVDLATNLYTEWGWAFKIAGLGFATAAVVAARKRSVCSTKPRLLRFTAILLSTAIVTYGLLYIGTTALGNRASASASTPVELEGDSPATQLASAITQVRQRYPGVVIDVEGASAALVRFRVTFSIPEDIDPASDEYNEQISRRAGDSREATLLLFQTIATQVGSVQRFSAFDDLMLVPTWSRKQILDSQEPHEYRDFDTYSRFVTSADTLSGYSQLQTDR